MAKFVIDSDQSRVWIDAKSSLHAIHSESNGLEGWFEADLLGGRRLNPVVDPSGQFELPVDKLSSGNPLYDREMQRRIDARRYPTISERLTAMKETDQDSHLRVAGDVIFRGVTRSFEDSMTMAMPDDNTLRLEGQRVFDIREFGMEPPRILMLRVYPEVSVRVSIVATRQGSG